MTPIQFNKPHLTGKETHYIYEAVASGKISGNGAFTKKCQQFIERATKTPKTLLTTSCTDALEMSALLARIKPGDEVIMPSFTFVSTANAFMVRGAKIVFVDSRKDHPGMDESLIEELINERTKAIVPVHYAGVACDMDRISQAVNGREIFIIEDAAQAIDSFYKNGKGELKALGSIGQLGAYSFHETKNIQCGEGGALLINDPKLCGRAEIIWEKGTNRTAFWRGEVDKYGWVDLGSSFLPSEVTAAFLYAQLEELGEIQQSRNIIWEGYKSGLSKLFDQGKVTAPHIPAYATNNAHMFYLICNTEQERTDLISHLKKEEIHSVFHYQSLHRSPFFTGLHDGRQLPLADRYSSCLLRLPLHVGISEPQTERIVSSIIKFYSN